MITSLEFMTAEVKCPFFIDKFHSLKIFSIRPLRFSDGRYKKAIRWSKNISGNDVLRKKVP